MTDPPQYPDTGDHNTGGEPGRGSTTGTPRWVKVFGLIALVGLMLFVVVLLVGGEHGPGRHTPSRGSDSFRGHAGPPPGFEHRDQQP